MSETYWWPGERRSKRWHLWRSNETARVWWQGEIRVPLPHVMGRALLRRSLKRAQREEGAA